MASYRLLCWLVYTGFILSMGGCAASTNCSAQTATNAQPLLLFQKTPCYGSCPAYNATFYADGSISYKGLRNTPVTGELQLCLPAKQLKEIKAQLEQLDVESLDKQYLSPYTDVPSTYLTFYSETSSGKRIKHQQGGPPQLQQVITLLDSTVTQLVREQQIK